MNKQRIIVRLSILMIASYGLSACKVINQKNEVPRNTTIVSACPTEKIGNKADNAIQEDINIPETIKMEAIPKEYTTYYWFAGKIVEKETGKRVGLEVAFGHSALDYPSYFKLNDDGTFVDSIGPVARDGYCRDGSYSLEQDDTGIQYLFLNYEDGRKATFKQVEGENNTFVTNSNGFTQYGEFYNIEIVLSDKTNLEYNVD